MCPPALAPVAFLPAPSKQSPTASQASPGKSAGPPRRRMRALLAVLTATKIQKNVTERCGLETASSTFRAMTPPRTAETLAVTSMTCGAEGGGSVARARGASRWSAPDRQAGWAGAKSLGRGPARHAESWRMTSKAPRTRPFQPKMSRKGKPLPPIQRQWGSGPDRKWQHTHACGCSCSRRARA